ncbi:AAA family ATPase [Thioflexithrix psekupsensis]|uniref:Protein CR006 P-loop domain-containing protein n=1 Tax=Thioflexithrix psekupsensis TaxID=1570016 RepID=A0A251X9L3_9GAMM|nr:AAA family ATPase [Thioflexithrix psekupsensis]OUD14696.1 hypothetical protein TPSD3_09870 [Thioflexithrix psekupsensis]
MDKLKVNLKNCYGIQSLDKEFDFTSSKVKAYAVYAPNGLMKTSFSKTFEAISKGDSPKEERYNRPSSCVVKSDNKAIQKEMIYVLKSEIDINSDSPAISNILVNPENKARYDALHFELDKLKKQLITSLQKASGIRKDDVEKTILTDWKETDFPTCIEKIKATSDFDDFGFYQYAKIQYATIFNPETIEVLQSPEFIPKVREFIEHYQIIEHYQRFLNQGGTLCQKGVFNLAKADTPPRTLQQRLKAIYYEKIDTNPKLKKLRDNLAKNAQTQALIDLIVTRSAGRIENLLRNLEPNNQAQFRRNLWGVYLKYKADSKAYMELYYESKHEIKQIETDAAQATPRWVKAIERFNNRFVDMPFQLAIANQAQAGLGKEPAKLKFIFTDGSDTVECSRSETNTLSTLSQGEKRSLYLLNFIFEVEARKLANQETLFIIDDIADSFDYKNKHAIVQYLKDITNIPNFHQIILTHNFDFFRTLANSFVHRDRCLMANRSITSITLTKAEGVKNYFINVWKNKVNTDDTVLCATIPFTRNLIEYIKGDEDGDYLLLTSLLHWKRNTEQITVGDYMGVYNRLFSTHYETENSTRLTDLLFTKSNEICNDPVRDGLKLEDKVLLSMSIRMKAEIFLIKELRRIKNDTSYWCDDTNQFGRLMKEFSSSDPLAPAIPTLEKISITVSSNIHLNSFMYEPIIDLTIEHLIELYKDVCNLL